MLLNYLSSLSFVIIIMILLIFLIIMISLTFHPNEINNHICCDIFDPQLFFSITINFNILLENELTLKIKLLSVYALKYKIKHYKRLRKNKTILFIINVCEKGTIVMP